MTTETILTSDLSLSDADQLNDGEARFLLGLQGQGNQSLLMHRIHHDCHSIVESDNSTGTVDSSLVAGLRDRPNSSNGVVHFSALELEEKTNENDQDPVEPVCHGGISLSSGKLAGILTFLEGAHLQWPAPSFGSADSGNDAKTTITSNLGSATELRNPLIISLERERAALKELSVSDSATILQLKTQLDFLRSSTSIKDLELQRISEELDNVKKERDLLLEREAQHLESLKVLKEEVDSLSIAVAPSNPHADKELERLRIENELFATQIIENEVEMREVRTVLEYLDAENSKMRKDLDHVRLRVSDGTNKSKIDPEPENHQTALLDQITDLVVRMTNLENDWIETKKAFEEERLLQSDGFEAITKIVQDRSNGKNERRVTSRVGMATSEGVEVTMSEPGRGSLREHPSKSALISVIDAWCGSRACCLRSQSKCEDEG